MGMHPCGTDVLVLAGGLGKRLRGMVSDRPKPLAVVSDRPFVEYLLEVLALHRFRSVTLCTGYMADHFEQGLSDHGISVHLSAEPEPLGTGGALAHAVASRQSAQISDPVLVMNGDSIADMDLTAFLEWFENRGVAAAVAAARVDDGGQFGKLALDAEHRVTGFLEKDGAAEPCWVNAGVYLLRGSVIDSIPRGRAVSLEREVFPELASDPAGGGLAAWCHCDRLIDIGTPERYSEAHRVVGLIRDNVAKRAAANVRRS